VLQPLYGGAMARPFVTHHNELKRDLYLRIAVELYLKRCIIGGIDRVYEIGKDFRNEGVSFKHNPEFTMLETYEAYVDYNHVMTMVEEMLVAAAKAVGDLKVQFRGHEIDLTPPWPRKTMREAITEKSGIDIGADDVRTVADLQARIKEAGLADKVPLAPTWGTQVDELFSEMVEPGLIQPVFITEHPLETSPFAKKCPHDPRFVERFEGFIAGMETSNAFSELNDPDDQRAHVRALLVRTFQDTRVISDMARELLKPSSGNEFVYGWKVGRAHDLLAQLQSAAHKLAIHLEVMDGEHDRAFGAHHDS